MNKDFIEKRLQEIEAALLQTVAQHNALHGAKSELLNLLKNIAINVGSGILEEAVAPEAIAQNDEQIKAPA
jgi:hypothetical protein